MVLVQRAFLDLIETLKGAQLLWFLAWNETRTRYRRSLFGPFWLTLGTGVGVVGLGFLWSGVMRIERAEFIPYLAAGMIVWQLISASVTEGTGVFLRQARMIRNLKLPYTLYPLQLLARQIINFLHNLVFFLAVAAFYGLLWDIHWPATLLGFLLLVMNLAWMILLLGTIGARFRDIEPLMYMLMPILFFMSPILFRGDKLEYAQILVWSNPLTYLITVVRDPLLGRVPDGFVYAATLALLAVGWAVTFLLFARKRERLPFWV